MIELIFGGMAYGAVLLNCYDGDSCNLRLVDAPAIVEHIPVRVYGVDTPEIRGRCPEEKALAYTARDYTRAYFNNNNITGSVVRTRDKYGRMVVEFPDLAESLIKAGLGRAYVGGKRKGWCND